MGRKRTLNEDLNLPEGIRVGRRPGVYEVRVTLPPDASGVRRQISRTVSGGINEAKKVRATLITNRDALGTGRGTVADVVNRWLDQVEPNLSPNTMRNYRAFSERYIMPELGTKQLKRLTTYDVEKFYGKLTARGLAPATVRQVHSILRKALAAGLRWGEVAVNVAVNAEAPKLTEKKLELPAVETYQAILAQANRPAIVEGKPKRRADPLMALFIWMAGATGARRAELCAIRWTDLDLEGHQLVIARSVLEVKDLPLGIKGTKTENIRRIAIGDEDVVMLRTRRREMESLARHHQVELDPEAYVFSDLPDGSEPWRPSRVTQTFRRITVDLGVQCRLHDLRHLHISLLLAAGVDVRTVAGRAGHSQPTMTLNRYGHFMPAADRGAATAIAGALRSAALMAPASASLTAPLHKKRPAVRRPGSPVPVD